MGRVYRKVALVTGAARGIGRAQAVRLAQEGADIVAIDICAPVRTAESPSATTADLAETERLIEAAGGRVAAYIVDVRAAAALSAAVDAGAARFGGIDIVCATAGIASSGAACDLSEDVWQTMLDVNLTGVWQTSKAAAPHLLARGSGSMILTSSVAGMRGLAGAGHYVSAGHGVVGLMRSLAKEFAVHNVRVNSVHSSETVVEPVDIANATLFLASDEARYITAVTLPVDAGNSQQ